MSSSLETVPRRRRGRPKAEELEGLEARLIQVGSRIFFKKGYGATTMSEVAKAAHASKTTLYARFPSKADLFRAIVADQVASWDTGLHHTPIEHAATLEQILLAYGDILLRAGMTADFIQLHRLMQSESGRFPELGAIADARFRRGVDFLTSQIRLFAERDNMPCGNAAGAAEIFLMTVMGWVSVKVVGNLAVSPEDRKARLADMVSAFLNGRSAW